MEFARNEEQAFGVIRWRPGIRGSKRSFQLRIMIRNGRLWFVTTDVARALGWDKREFHAARMERLEGNAWGTLRSQWCGEGPSLLFISLTALTVVLAGRYSRHNRAFLRWLDSLKGVEESVDAVDFGVDHSTDADHSVGAYIASIVDHASGETSIRHHV